MFQKDIFENQVVLVTGGGSGIGYVIAKLFIEFGAKVVIASRKQEKIEKAQQSLGENCVGKVLDIRHAEQAEAVIQSIVQDFGKLDILVNNAGGQFPAAAENISTNGWNAVINNNLNGTFYVTKAAFLHAFQKQNYGNIINLIANIYRGFPGMSHTGAARAGVDNLTKSLAVEWSRFKIRVNAVAPGIINSSGLDQYPPKLLENIQANIPLKRMGTCEEVAYLVLFLASPMASYITGETIYVDGGMRLWGDLWEM
jgi:citronellol/citronellal dehydrogenase